MPIHRLVPPKYSKVCGEKQILRLADTNRNRLCSYWSNEFALFYNPGTGLDIDGAWIDMNEPASVSKSTYQDPYWPKLIIVPVHLVLC